MLRTNKQKFIGIFLIVMGGLFGALTLWSLTAGGKQVFGHRYTSAQFLREKQDISQARTFTLDKRSVLQLEAQAHNLNDSWVWLKVLILDEKDRPIYDYKMDLSYYSGYSGGEHWVEDKTTEDKVFTLKPGTYKVVAYSSNKHVKGGRAEKLPMDLLESVVKPVTVTIDKNVILTRYFLILFIIFGGGAILYLWYRNERSKTEGIDTMYGGNGGDYSYGDDEDSFEKY